MGNTLKRAKSYSRIKPNIGLSKNFLDSQKIAITKNILDSLSYDTCTKSSYDSTTTNNDDIIEIDDADELDDIEVEDDDNYATINQLCERSNGVKVTRLIIDDVSMPNKNTLYKKRKSDTHIHALRKIPSKTLN